MQTRVSYTVQLPFVGGIFGAGHAGIPVSGMHTEVVDRFKQLEAEVPMNYLMLAPMSQDTFERFTRDVLPKLV